MRKSKSIIDKDYRRSLGDKPEFEPKRNSDTLEGLIHQVETIKAWAVEHEENHQALIQQGMIDFMESEKFPKLILKLMQYEDVKKAGTELMDKFTGQFVRAIFINRYALTIGVMLIMWKFDIISLDTIITYGKEHIIQ